MTLTKRLAGINYQSSLINLEHVVYVGLLPCVVVETTQFLKSLIVVKLLTIARYTMNIFFCSHSYVLNSSRWQ